MLTCSKYVYRSFQQRPENKRAQEMGPVNKVFYWEKV